MNRLQSLFSRKSSDILSVFLTAGFPRLDSTVEIIRELDRRGIDMVEIGVPFSDPMADGTVIQHSSSIALDNGMSLLNTESFWQYIVKGVILIGAVWIDITTKKRTG